MNYSIRNLLRLVNVLTARLQIEYYYVRRERQNKTQVVTHLTSYIELRGKIEHTNICNNDKPNLTKNLLPSDSSCDEEKSPICIGIFLDIFGDFEWKINKIMNEYCELLPRENNYIRVRSRVDDYESSAVTINCECSAKWTKYSLSNTRCLNNKKTKSISFRASLISKALLRRSVFRLLRYVTFDFMI